MGNIKIGEATIASLLRKPEHAVEELNLVYVNSDELAIVRERHGKKFQYVYLGRPLDEPKDLKRIEDLAIPPAWQDVKISHLYNGHLQAIGKDLRQRKQYKYHPIWTKIRNQTKFYKMVAFAEQLPKIRKRVDMDLDMPGWPQEKVLALIIRLMEETHIRVGNQQYAKRNKTYGLSTLRTRHVKVFQDKLKFEFTGKRGKKHTITLRNKRLMRLVSQCEELPGWELFKFYDDQGEKQPVDSGMVNEYVHEICGELFTAKDFRTWAATLIFFESLREMEYPESEQQADKNVLKALDLTAKELGNTRNVCRKYYVHPYVISSYYQQDFLRSTFDKIASHPNKKDALSPTEMALLDLITSFTPVINLN